MSYLWHSDISHFQLPWAWKAPRRQEAFGQLCLTRPVATPQFFQSSFDPHLDSDFYKLLTLPAALP